MVTPYSTQICSPDKLLAYVLNFDQSPGSMNQTEREKVKTIGSQVLEGVVAF